MSVFSFNHIALSVKDVSITVAFYQKVFAFEEIENTASDSNTRWLAIGVISANPSIIPDTGALGIVLPCVSL